MGCSHSSLEQDKHHPPGGSFMLQLFRRRRGKDCSTASTTELLRRDNPHTSANAPRGDWKGRNGRSKLSVVKEEEEERGSSAMRSNKEELPGSPSFRFYFDTPAGASNNDGNGNQNIKKDRQKRH